MVEKRTSSSWKVCVGVSLPPLALHTFANSENHALHQQTVYWKPTTEVKSVNVILVFKGCFFF